MHFLCILRSIVPWAACSTHLSTINSLPGLSIDDLPIVSSPTYWFAFLTPGSPDQTTQPFWPLVIFCNIMILLLVVRVLKAILNHTCCSIRPSEKEIQPLSCIPPQQAMETELVDQVPEPLWEPTESSDDVSKDQVMVVNETNIASNDQEPISDSTGGYEDVFEPSYMVPDVLDHSDTLEPLCPGLLNDPIMSNTNDSMAEAPNVPEAVVLSTKPQCLDSPTEEPVCSPTDVSKVDSDGTDDQKTDSSTATKISTSNKKKPKKNKKRKGGW